MSDETPLASVTSINGHQTPKERREALQGLLSAWWTPPEELIDTLPKGGMQLKYLSHVWVSRAFSEVDPEWTWAPMGFDDHGQPVIERDAKGNPVGLWITLTLCGTTIPGYGSCEPGKRDAIKELIGDALRNAGMRRGVAGSLWTKEKPKKPEKKEPLPAAVERNLEHLREQVVDDAAQGDKEAGKELYERLVAEWGEELVKGALATHNVSMFKELTPAKGKVIEASLKARARLVKEEEDRAMQLAKEQKARADG